jgi:V/A-type H+-transporting ATPase subunit I
LIQKQHIDYEKVDWETPIVNWRVPNYLQGSTSIARSLGTIGVRETDPSGAILIFFSFFFALCLSDAFYGLIITLICGYFLFGTRLKSQFRPLFTLFLSSGVATIIFGALTNSWAGDLFENTPLQGVLKPFHVFEPLNPDAPVLINQFLKVNGGINPIVAFLGLSIAIGIITLFSGYLIRLQTAIKSHDKNDALNVLSWMGLLLTIIGTIGLSVAGVSVGYLSILLALVFASGLFIWNGGQHIATKVLYGLGTLYGLISFVADVLSFTRLVAVGLTSGIIASVVNMLGFMVYDAISLPILNIIVTAVVLIFGHIFNLIISLFGAYVNPLRLHYVEFMPKFYKGQAKQIQPADTRNYSYLQIS